MGMTKEDKFAIGMAIQKIAMSVDDETLNRIKPYLNTIEDTIVMAEKRNINQKNDTKPPCYVKGSK